MRKQIIAPESPPTPTSESEWLPVEQLAEADLTSEDAAHPLEAALTPGRTGGWQAAAPGKQTIRLRFTAPQRLRRIWLHFEEPAVVRTQEYVLRWSADSGQAFREIVRQQWNFTPQGANAETEDHRVDLPAATALELSILPDISGGPALASLAQWRLA